MIDSHAHVGKEEFDPDRDEVLARARAAGVRWIVEAATDAESARATLAFARRAVGVRAAVGVLGLVLGGAMERALRQSLMMSEGSLSILVARPISAVMLSLALLILLIRAFSKVNAWRQKLLS